MHKPKVKLSSEHSLHLMSELQVHIFFPELSVKLPNLQFDIQFPL